MAQTDIQTYGTTSAPQNDDQNVQNQDMGLLFMNVLSSVILEKVKNDKKEKEEEEEKAQKEREDSPYYKGPYPMPHSETNPYYDPYHAPDYDGRAFPDTYTPNSDSYQNPNTYPNYPRSRPQTQSSVDAYGQNRGSGKSLTNKDVRYMPSMCFTRAETTGGNFPIVDTECLIDKGFDVSDLPVTCEIYMNSFGIDKFGYDPNCLQDKGFRASNNR
jgi:hypothetical protein